MNDDLPDYGDERFYERRNAPTERADVCRVHGRYLSRREFLAGACSWCQPTPRRWFERQMEE